MSSNRGEKVLNSIESWWTQDLRVQRKHSDTSRSKPALVCINSVPSQLFIKFFSDSCFRYTGSSFYIDLTQSLGKTVFCQMKVGVVVLMDRKSD